MDIFDNRHPDRADMGGGADVYARWGSGMTEKEREELISKMADAMFATDEDGTLRVDVMARAALAVAEPVIREQCAQIVEKGTYETRWKENERAIAAAIREGGNE